MDDPWAVLGLSPGSSLDEAKAARRRLAKELHPDLHAARPVAERAELARRMTQVNLAMAELEATAPLSAGGSGSGGATGPGRDGRAAGGGGAGGFGEAGAGGSGSGGRGGTRRVWGRGPVPSPVPSPSDRPTGPRGPDQEGLHPAATMLDAESFALDVLPVEAFEAVFLAGYNLGEILVADEPYALELYLPGPPPCFCQLFLAPEEGGSIVTLDLTPAEGVDPPDVRTVQHLLVSELNELAGSPRA